MRPDSPIIDINSIQHVHSGAIVIPRTPTNTLLHQSYHRSYAGLRVILGRYSTRTLIHSQFSPDSSSFAGFANESTRLHGVFMVSTDIPMGPVAPPLRGGHPLAHAAEDSWSLQVGAIHLHDGGRKGGNM